MNELSQKTWLCHDKYDRVWGEILLENMSLFSNNRIEIREE